MTQRVGTKGQVVIPKRLRESHGLGPGEPVSFEDRDDGVLIRTGSGSVEELRGRYERSRMAAELLEDRANERR